MTISTLQRQSTSQPCRRRFDAFKDAQDPSREMDQQQCLAELLLNGEEGIANDDTMVRWRATHVHAYAIRGKKVALGWVLYVHTLDIQNINDTVFLLGAIHGWDQKHDSYHQLSYLRLLRAAASLLPSFGLAISACSGSAGNQRMLTDCDWDKIWQDMVDFDVQTSEIACLQHNDSG